MLEIILLVVFSQKLAGVARSKGRPAALGALFAAGWIAGELAGGVLGALIFDDLMGAYVLALVCAIGGGVVAWVIVRSLPPAEGFVSETFAAPGIQSTGVELPPAQPVSVRRAGYCLECGKNVWLTGTGSCPNGHGPQSLTRIYTVDG